MWCDLGIRAAKCVGKIQRDLIMNIRFDFGIPIRCCIPGGRGDANQVEAEWQKILDEHNPKAAYVRVPSACMIGWHLPSDTADVLSAVDQFVRFWLFFTSDVAAGVRFVHVFLTCD
jgi:hypothetical protein